MQALFIRCLILSLYLLLLSAGPAIAVDVSTAAEHDHGGETIWTCSMHPQIQLPEPGQCPICFMDLIEVKKESSENLQSLRQVSFDRRARKLAEVEVQAVSRGKAATEIHMVGKIDYDETRVGTITSWVNGRIDKLYVDYTGSRVRRGQAMANVYSPELLTAQAELIQATAEFKRTEQSENEIIRKTASRTLAASREKLRLLGLSEKQLRAIEKQGKPTDHITLTAPLSGIVIQKDVNEGMYVKTGSTIYTLADLSKVWVVLEAYESDLQAISLGQQVRFTVESYPGTAFQGEVAYIDPLVNERSRTVRVRLNVDNKDGKLKPGMFVRAVSSSAVARNPEDAPLLIPVSAPLITGKRALVYVQPPRQPGTYIGREIVLGPRQGSHYQVKSGLKEGELVVTRGNFKIDSAIQLQARPSMMNPYFEESTDSASSYPTLFVSRLNLLNNLFAELSKEVHEQNHDAYDTALKNFNSTLATIDADGLEEEDRLSWQELSMLLGSDIILLREAENDGEVERVYTTLAEHFHQLRLHFSLNDTVAARAGSSELRDKIGRLLNNYLLLEQHLAADNLKGAREEIIALTPLADSLVAALHETGEDLASTLAASVAEDMSKLTSAETLSEIRTVFYQLSQSFIRIVETFGSDGKSPWYIHFCPMANDNKGATWLAPSEEINNPYFGAMMLRCGEVRKQLTQ
ncbi:MAG: efflux RND transporter periplasmic adaptor subunit [Desulfocapsa sp.]|nr:efflux RND transporter periplasmic adaptor subunit [Desulfocapsa sp.]